MIPLGTIFQSHDIVDPWAKSSPADTNSLLSVPIIVHREDGTESSFTSHSTSSTSASHDHLSIGLGVGVGLPFLAEVSVTGTYDRDVLENKDVSLEKSFLDNFLPNSSNMRRHAKRQSALRSALDQSFSRDSPDYQLKRSSL